MAVPDLSRHAVELVVRDAIASVLPTVGAETIEGQKHLRDLGADSVDRVEIVLSLLERLRLDEPMSSFSRLPNIDALITFLHEKCR